MSAPLLADFTTDHLRQLVAEAESLEGAGVSVLYSWEVRTRSWDGRPVQALDRSVVLDVTTAGLRAELAARGE